MIGIDVCISYAYAYCFNVNKILVLLFIYFKKERKEKREIFTLTLPAFSTTRLPSLTCVFFFPTHTLLFFFTNHTPFSLPHYNTSSLSPTYILPFSLSPTHSSFFLFPLEFYASLPLTFPFSHSLTHTLPPLPSS